MSLFIIYHHLPHPNYRCTLNPSDQLAMEGPLSRVKSIKKSLRQSFRRIRRSRVSLRKHHVNNTAKVGPLRGETATPLKPPFSQPSPLSSCSSRRPTLVWRPNWQRWSSLPSRGRSRLARRTTLSPVLCGLSTSPTPSSQTVSHTVQHYMSPLRKNTVQEVFPRASFCFLAGTHNTPSLWAGTNGGCVFAYMLRLPPTERRADEPVTAQPGEEKNVLFCFVFFMFGFP